MITEIIAKAQGFMVNPVECYQNSRGDESFVVLYFLALLAVSAVLTTGCALIGISAVGSFTQMMPAAAVPPALFLCFLVGGIIMTAVFSLWLHLWVYILGGRKGIWQTVKAVVYGMTPGLLLGWIPFIGPLFALWSIVLQILGIRELQEISSKRAILALFIAVVVPLMLLILLALYFMVNTVAFSTIPAAPENYMYPI